MEKIPAATYSCGTYRPTTIGAAAFHFRVRNGTGWDHCALATGLQGEDLFVSSSCLPGSPAFWGLLSEGFFQGMCVAAKKISVLCVGRDSA